MMCNDAATSLLEIEKNPIEMYKRHIYSYSLTNIRWFRYLHAQRGDWFHNWSYCMDQISMLQIIAEQLVKWHSLLYIYIYAVRLFYTCIRQCWSTFDVFYNEKQRHSGPASEDYPKTVQNDLSCTVGSSIEVQSEVKQENVLYPLLLC